MTHVHFVSEQWPQMTFDFISHNTPHCVQVSLNEGFQTSVKKYWVDIMLQAILCNTTVWLTWMKATDFATPPPPPLSSFHAKPLSSLHTARTIQNLCVSLPVAQPVYCPYLQKADLPSFENPEKGIILCITVWKVVQQYCTSWNAKHLKSFNVKNLKYKPIRINKMFQKVIHCKQKWDWNNINKRKPQWDSRTELSNYCKITTFKNSFGKLLV